jgi:hypothetical protein
MLTTRAFLRALSRARGAEQVRDLSLAWCEERGPLPPRLSAAASRRLRARPHQAPRRAKGAPC